MHGHPTQWCVITGAPCAGKTTVLVELQKRGFRVVWEAARELIEADLRLGRTLDQIRPHHGDFQRRLIPIKKQVEDSLPTDRTIFLDRAMPDSLSYFRLAGLDPVEILDECSSHRYLSVFLFDRLSVSENDGVRVQSEDSSTFLDRWLEQDYRSLGCEIVRVPVMSILKRVEFVLRQLKQISP